MHIKLKISEQKKKEKKRTACYEIFFKKKRVTMIDSHNQAIMRQP